MSSNCKLTAICSNAHVVQPPLFRHCVGPLVGCVGVAGAMFQVGVGALFHVWVAALFHVGPPLDCVGPIVALSAGPVAAGSTCAGGVQGSGSSPSKSVSGVSHATWACADTGSRERTRTAVLGMAMVAIWLHKKRMRLLASKPHHCETLFCMTLPKVRRRLWPLPMCTDSSGHMKRSDGRQRASAIDKSSASSSIITE